MNRRQFKIYKIWREKKYQRDLEKLQNDLASRGLAISGIRKKEEEWLKDEFDGELEKEKTEMEEYEKEAKEKQKTRLNQCITNWILAIAAMIALSINIAVWYSGILIDQKINRPYLFIDKIEIDPISDEKYDYKVIITYKNGGPIPAINSNIIVDIGDIGEKRPNVNEEVKGQIVGPEEESEVWILLTEEDVVSINWNNDPKKYITIRTEYQDPTTERHHCDESKHLSLMLEGVYKISTETSYSCKPK